MRSNDSGATAEPVKGIGGYTYITPIDAVLWVLAETVCEDDTKAAGRVYREIWEREGDGLKKRKWVE